MFKTKSDGERLAQIRERLAWQERVGETHILLAVADLRYLCERVEQLQEAFDAMVVATKQGQPCYRTSNDIPQGMPKKAERAARRALAGQPEEGTANDVDG